MSTIYLPIGSPEMIAHATRLSEGRVGKGKSSFTLISCTDDGLDKWKRRNRVGGLLRGVETTEKLYVMIHGVSNAADQPVGLVSVNRGATPHRDRGLVRWGGGRSRSYTPWNLAEHLKGEGLRSQFIDLRLFSCFSADPVAGSTGNVTFARALKVAMTVIGFTAIMVTGYYGAVSNGYGQVYMEGANLDKGGIVAEPLMPYMSQDAYKTVVIKDKDMVASKNKKQW